MTWSLSSPGQVTGNRKYSGKPPASPLPRVPCPIVACAHASPGTAGACGRAWRGPLCSKSTTGQSPAQPRRARGAARAGDWGTAMGEGIASRILRAAPSPRCASPSQPTGARPKRENAMEADRGHQDMPEELPSLPRHRTDGEEQGGCSAARASWGTRARLKVPARRRPTGSPAPGGVGLDRSSHADRPRTSRGRDVRDQIGLCRPQG